VRTNKKFMIGMIYGLLGMGIFNAHAETVLFAMDNVLLTNSTPMQGIFYWTYTNDFKSGSGAFLSLDIPWTAHDETDLLATIDVTESIEITFTNNVHDDGVDIMLVLAEPLTSTTSSSLIIGAEESKYEIGGNKSHTGLVESGSIVPTNLTLNIAVDSPGYMSIDWMPELSGMVLQETPGLLTNWIDSASGSTNPTVVPVTTPSMFYRVRLP
jgi:hypothetical protein